MNKHILFLFFVTLSCFLGCSEAKSADPIFQATINDVKFDYEGKSYVCQKVIGVGDRDDGGKTLFMRCKNA